MFQNSERVVLKGMKPKTDHCRSEYKEPLYFFSFKKLKFQIKYQGEEHDQISNKCIQKHTSTKYTLKCASKGTSFQFLLNVEIF